VVDIDENKRAVVRYFKALDDGDLAAVEQLFAHNCRIHRPGLHEPLIGHDGIKSVVSAAKERYRVLKTEIGSILAEGDLVACRLHHYAEFVRPWPTRLGAFDVTGKNVSWDPLVLFRFELGKIAEEWVCRDELGMMIDLGVLTAPS